MSGGAAFAGLEPKHVPGILRRGEEVLAKSCPAPRGNTVHQVTTGKLLALVALVLLAGAGLGWVAHKQQLLHQAAPSCAPASRPAQILIDPTPHLRDIAPRWRKA